MKLRLAKTTRMAFLIISCVYAAFGQAESRAVATWQEQTDLALQEHVQSLVSDAKRLNQSVEIKVSEYDKRLNFAACQETPEVSSRSAANSGRVTVKVRCPGPSTWQMHVTLMIDRYAEVAVLKETVSRRSRLSSHQIEMKRQNVASLRQGFYQSAQNLEGLVAKRHLKAGTVLHPGLLVPPKLVKRGDRVVIAARNPAISVRMSGKALSDGHLGQQISVENLNSGRRIRATVTGESQVEVAL